MSGELLGRAELTNLRRAGLTYAEVGATKLALPRGYRHLRRRIVIGAGDSCFDESSRVLLHWDMHRRAGLRVLPSNESVDEGDVALLLLGLGAMSVRAPVRVVYLLDEPERRGFAYGTLPGHPESGEEAFVVERQANGTVTATITAFSRPSSLLARAAGPIGRAAQRGVTNRYLRALRPIER